MSSLINRFYKLRDKRQRFLNHLGFLLKCKKFKVIPGFIHVKCNLRLTKRVSKTLNRTQHAFLRSVIQDTRSHLAKIERDLFQLHLSLAHTVSNFFVIEFRSWSRSVLNSRKHNITLSRKLDKLLSTQRKQNRFSCLPTVNNNVIVNLSDKVLSNSQIEILKRNSNFSVTTNPSFQNLIAPVERSFKFSKLSSLQKESIRHLILNTVDFNKKCTNSNLRKNEKDALRELKSEQDILITKADKGGQIVILNRNEYISGVHKMLEEGPYSRIKKDPSSNELTKIKSAIKSSKILTEYSKKDLTPSISNAARFYALPKIHKSGVPLRPIVSNIGTASHKLSKYLTSVFSPLLVNNTHTVKNSYEFVNIIKNVNPKNLTMVSFDVKSLFTNVPIEGSLECLKRRLTEFHFTQFEIYELMTLTSTCLTQTTFVFQGGFYKQNEGLAMGKSLSPLLCDIYMHYFEETFFSKISLPLWLRYVDDTFVVFNPEVHNIPDILSTLNSIDPCIQFTCELEHNCTLPFLDILVKRETESFSTSVYRKPFSVTLPPHAKSCHPFKQKIGIFYGYVHRAIKICSTQEALDNELNYLRAVALDRGYSPLIIDQAVTKFKNPHTIQDHNTTLNTNVVVLPFYPKASSQIANILKKFDIKVVFSPVNKLQFSKLKDPIPDLDNFGIYCISCECNQCYIGQTRRSLRYRVKEHENHVKKQEVNKSAIAQHCWETGHKFNFNSASLIQKTNSVHYLDFLECFHIFKNFSNIVNNISFVPPISDTWKLYINIL